MTLKLLLLLQFLYYGAVAEYFLYIAIRVVDSESRINEVTKSDKS